jgi:hypothetical protein
LTHKIPDQVFQNLTGYHSLLVYAIYSNKDINKDIDQTIEVCHAILPEYGGVLPLLLLSISVRNAEFQIRSPSPAPSIIIRNILAVLPESSRGKSFPPWMLETINWKFDSFSKQGDLLVFFRERIVKLAPEDRLPTDDVFNRALSYGDTLQKQRAILAADMGIDLKAKTRRSETKQSKRGSQHDLRKDNST